MASVFGLEHHHPTMSMPWGHGGRPKRTDRRMYMRGVLLKAVIDAYPSTPRRTITDRSKRTIENKKIKKMPGPQPVLTEEVEEDLKIWIFAMQKSGAHVTRIMVLIKGNQIFLEAYGMKKKRQG